MTRAQRRLPVLLEFCRQRSDPSSVLFSLPTAEATAKVNGDATSSGRTTSTGLTSCSRATFDLGRRQCTSIRQLHCASNSEQYHLWRAPDIACCSHPMRLSFAARVLPSNDFIIEEAVGADFSDRASALLACPSPFWFVFLPRRPRLPRPELNWPERLNMSDDRAFI